MKMIKDMKTMTQEQMLDKYIGKKGSPERAEYESEVRKAIDDYRIGEAIKAERKKQGLTQEQLGERIGVQKSQISRIENGKGSTYSTLVRVFKALGARTATLELGGLGRVALW